MELNKFTKPENIQIVTNPYGRSDSKKRKGIIVSGIWSDSITRYVRENNIRALYLNSAHGWSGVDYGFLAGLNTIEELHIISAVANNLSSIEKMVGLVELSITVSTKDEINFQKLSALKKCYLYWWAGAESILDCKDIEMLYLDGFKIKDLNSLKKINKIKSLTIANSKIDNIDWLVDFHNLAELELINCKKINSFDSIKNCSLIKKLTISGVRTLKNIEFLSLLPELEILVLSDCSEIDSIAVVSNLNNLKAFSFAGSTSIKDGDLGVLVDLPKLSMLMFQERKHYTHRLVKKWNWENFNNPSKLLVIR